VAQQVSGASSHHQELTTVLTASGFTVGQQRRYHHAPTVKPEATNAVVGS